MTALAAEAPAKPAKAVLANTRVVILGGLSTVAMATARLYANDRASIVIVGRNAERLEQAAADLRARGAAKVEAIDLDLAGEAINAKTHLVDWSQRLGGIDHVLVFYGYLGTQDKAWTDISELNRILTVNFTSAALWCGAAGEIMRKQKRGSVVAVTSVAGDRGRQSNFAYGAAKGGLSVFMQGMAHALAPEGARAVSIKLGPTQTPMTAGMPGHEKMAKPESVAPAIRRAADKGGPIQYVPGKWKIIMGIIRLVPSFVFHKTKL